MLAAGKRGKVQVWTDLDDVGVGGEGNGVPREEERVPGDSAALRQSKRVRASGLAPSALDSSAPA